MIIELNYYSHENPLERLVTQKSLHSLLPESPCDTAKSGTGNWLSTASIRDSTRRNLSFARPVESTFGCIPLNLTTCLLASSISTL
jgi:hypothetical protein